MRITKVNEKEKVIAWYSSDTHEITSCWMDNGMTAVPLKAITVLRYTTDFNNLVEGLAYLTKNDLYICTTCAKVFNKPAALRHFAGVYCTECADQYKHTHSKICGMCGQPLWRCTC